jgi:hypothetical protein
MMLGSSGRWLRSAWSVGLITSALVVSLVLAAWFVSLEMLRASAEDTIDHPARPFSDAQAMAQVVEPARQIGGIAQLQRPNGGYTLLSCKNQADPPYQGAVYISFELPHDALSYYQKVANAMTTLGWSEGQAPNRNMPAKMLTKDGVTAIFTRNSDDIRVGMVRVYGECRDISDHRRDTTAWVDISDQLP